MINRILVTIVIAAFGLNGLLLLTLGLVLLVLSLKTGLRRNQRARTKVLRHETGADEQGGSYAILVFCADETEHLIQLRGAAIGPEAYVVGQEVTLYYAPGAPGDAAPSQFRALRPAVVLLLVMGAVLLTGVWAGGLIPILSVEAPDIIDGPR